MTTYERVIVTRAFEERGCEVESIEEDGVLGVLVDNGIAAFPFFEAAPILARLAENADIWGRLHATA